MSSITDGQASQSTLAIASVVVAAATSIYILHTRRQRNERPRSNQINENPANGRLLLGDDLEYFRGGLYFLGGVMAFSIQASDKKLHRGFRQMLVTAPLLRTRVVGDPKGSPVFQEIEDPGEWPQLQILEPGPGGTDEEALTRIRDFKSTTETMFFQDKEAQRTSLRFAICRGKSKLYTAIVAPHSFLDGTGLGVAVFKTIAFAKLPRFVWPLLNVLRADCSVPLFVEMAFKKDYHLYHKVDGSLVKHIDDPNGLSFGEVDPLNLGGFDQAVVGRHGTKKTIGQFKKSMKAQNLTISTAFMGLAIKVIGTLVVDRPFESVLSTLPCDARYLGEWGDSRDQQVISGNYAYALQTTVSAELARRGSWQEIALQVQDHLKRIRNDIGYRLHYMQYRGFGRSEFCGYLVGLSSVMIPNSLVQYGLGLSDLDVFINFGPTPRCWFYLITVGSKTQVAIDIMLPGVKKEETRLVLQDIIKNSDFEPLFNGLDVLNQE